MNKRQKIWETDYYYQKAYEASLSLSHPGLQLIKDEAKRSKKILEVACGEGTKLACLTTKEKKVFGIDISKKAIMLAKKKYPWINFKNGNAEQLPFLDNFFDLVFCAFGLEHIGNSQKAIKEMIRVLEPQGRLVLVAPNFGAPNRASPCFKGSRVLKLLTGFVDDLITLVSPRSNLGWGKVLPMANGSHYKIDWDVEVEPYLRSLIGYIDKQGLKITRATSLWASIEENLSTSQKIFKLLAKIGLYPFKYWGPHLVLVAKKKCSV